MKPNIINRIKDTLAEPDEDKRNGYAKQAESFLNGGPSRGGGVSWGLLILGLAGVYAVVELCIVIIKLFQ